MVTGAAVIISAIGAGDANAHPILSSDPNWAGALLIVAGGLFLAALAVGLVVRFNSPRELSSSQLRDEPPGASHHHDA